MFRFLLMMAGLLAVVGGLGLAALTIESPAKVWMAISRGEMNGAEAFLNETYRADGDLGILLQLDKLFSSQSS